MGQGLQNPDLSVEQLYEQAKQAAHELDALGNNFLEYLQNKYPEKLDGVYFEQAPLKNFERVKDKIAGDYNGDHTKVADIVRGRLVVETPEQIQIIRGEITNLQESLGIAKVKDFYAEPLEGHFRTLNTQAVLPGGHVAEFRIDQADMAIASDATHELYEEKQAIERQANIENRPLSEQEIDRLDEIIDELRVEFDRAANKADLDTLLNDRGAAMIEAHRNSRIQALADTFGDLGKKGGLVTRVAVSGLVGAFTLAASGDSAQAAEVVYETAVPYGETQLDLADGDLEAAAKSATIETVSNIGAGGGMLAGAAIGTAILPGVGTAVGAVVGGIGAGIASGEATEFIYDHADDIADWWDDSDDKLLARLPTDIGEDAPPELQHMVEIKRILVDAQDQRQSLGDDGWFSDDGLEDQRDALDKQIERIEQMYDDAYDTYKESGALDMAIASLSDWERAEHIAQQAIENMTRDDHSQAPQEDGIQHDMLTFSK